MRLQLEETDKNLIQFQDAASHTNLMYGNLI
jgi:hypothetical protein